MAKLLTLEEVLASAELAESNANVVAMEQTIDISEIDISISELCCSVETTINLLDSVIDAVTTNESTFEIATEAAENQKTTLWQKILEKLSEFGKKIRDLWISVINWIKKNLIDSLQQKWFKKAIMKLPASIKNAPQDIRVRIHRYTVSDPQKQIREDMSSCIKLLTQMYSETGKYVELLLTDKSWWERFISNESKNRSFHKEMLRGLWSGLVRLCGISSSVDMGAINASAIRNSIYEKYFGTTDPVPAEYPPSSLVKTEDDAVLFSEVVYTSVQKMCESISTGSSKAEFHIRRLDTYVNGNKNLKPGGAARKEIEARTNGSIAAVRLSLSLCNSLGQTFWGIFMRMRSDTRICMKEYIKYSNAHSSDKEPIK